MKDLIKKLAIYNVKEVKYNDNDKTYLISYEEDKKNYFVLYQKNGIDITNSILD